MPPCEYTVSWCSNTMSHPYAQHSCRTGRKHIRIYENSNAQDLQDSEYVWRIRDSFITEIMTTLLHKVYCLSGHIQGSSVLTLRTFTFILFLAIPFSLLRLLTPLVHPSKGCIWLSILVMCQLSHINVKLVTVRNVVWMWVKYQINNIISV